MMNKAETMRKLTTDSIKSREDKRNKQYDKYISKLMTKIRKRAINGYSRAQIKIKRTYAPTVVATKFEEMGFNTLMNTKNGRQYLKIKW